MNQREKTPEEKFRAPQPGAGKEIASFFLTPACDMGCPFCASETGFGVFRPEELEITLRSLRDQGMGNVVFGGGEPMLWPHDLSAMTRLAKDLGFVVQLSTNGLAGADAICALDGLDRVILPVESVDDTVHDPLRPILLTRKNRNTEGHGQRVRDLIGELSQRGKSITLGTVVSAQNIVYLDRLADWVGGLPERGVDLHAWHLYNFVPFGRGGRDHAASLEIPRESFIETCRMIKQRGFSFPVYRRSHMLRSSSVAFYWKDAGRLMASTDTDLTDFQVEQKEIQSQT